ncbi:hypothetical protein [Micromonospora sp. NBC_01796]|uniref:hypothetical protein n=1 Tax=Micromonospora sp. NBC_01796 TaxID=2975987 RepID=UPI002DD89C54|nr:hypothetical protein [Micromonospora sp. NBC_01796]WSA87625.1 hypothetical protein OIE47_08455 [Micromonospora sp. NBC_01796]
MRAGNVRHLRHLTTTAPVPGLSPAALAQLAHIERTKLRGHSVAGALWLCQQFVKQPSRVLYLPMDEDSCVCHGLPVARALLDEALAALPEWAGRKLRQAVERFDQEFLDRTLPEPNAASHRPHWTERRYEDWSAQEWWSPPSRSTHASGRRRHKQYRQNRVHRL